MALGHPTHNTHGLIAHGKVSDPVVDVSIQERVSRVTAPIFAAAMGQVPSEMSLNSRAIGGYQKECVQKLWRPNNYRRKLQVQSRSKGGYANFEKILQRYYLEVVTNSHNKLVTIKDYPHITLQLGRDSVSAQWKQNVIGGAKETFCIEFDEPESLKNWIALKVEEIRKTCDAALFDFVQRTGLGVAGAVPMWTHFEDWIKEPGLVRIPREVIVYDSFFKKVYSVGVEFTPMNPNEIPGERLSTYLSNRAFEEQMPRISAEMARYFLDLEKKAALRHAELMEAKTGLPYRALDIHQQKLSKFQKEGDGV